MIVLVTCKNEEDPFKSKGSQHFFNCKSIVIFSNAQGQVTLQSVVRSCLNSNSFEPLKKVIVSCKNEEDPIKNKGVRVLTRLSFTMSYQCGGTFKTRNCRILSKIVVSHVCNIKTQYAAYTHVLDKMRLNCYRVNNNGAIFSESS